MIKSLRTRHTGLAPELSVEWSKRFNLITGDNGLGKSFLLDLSWWGLTHSWAGPPAMPNRGQPWAELNFILSGKDGDSGGVSQIDIEGNDLAERLLGRTVSEGVVVYVRVDGGFSVWDKARNGFSHLTGRPKVYNFATEQVWNGLDLNGIRVCEGLERDWVTWQKGQEPQFIALQEVLKALSPPGEPIQPATPQRVFLGEGRDRPMIVHAGQTVPLVHASAGIRRIMALAYLLVWSWFEYLEASELRGKPPSEDFVVLFDEPETHLHPKWQRSVLPSVRAALMGFLNNGEPQVLVATHAPLVLASIEPFFDPALDDLINLGLEDGVVKVTQGLWSKQGDAANWLVSEAFGLEQARSLPAEQAIEAAEAFMRGAADELPEDLNSKDKIHAALQRLLPDHDRFWARWLVRTGGLGD